MTDYNMENYAAQYVTKPSEKVQKGEVAGSLRLLFDKRTIAETLQVGDKLLCGFLPANCIVTNAKVRIDKSLGATGKFTLGHEANTDDSADPDAFIAAAECDAGGQAVLAIPKLTAIGIFKRFESETQVVLVCTEVLDGNVTDGIIYVEVNYVSD